MTGQFSERDFRVEIFSADCTPTSFVTEQSAQPVMSMGRSADTTSVCNPNNFHAKLNF